MNNKVKSIYLDYQATTPVDLGVYEKMRPFFFEAFANPHSSEHAGGWTAAKAVERAAGQVAGLVGADADEIIFCSGATEANNLAILGSARKSKKKNRILVSSVEHKCVIESARHLGRSDKYTFELIPVKKDGEIDLDWLQEKIDEDVILVSVMAVNNEIGTIQPLWEIGKIISDSGAIFHCDAAQAPCAIDIDVFNLRIDLLSLSGHKMYGPKGIGALYVRRDLHSAIEPLFYGGGQQQGLRPGTLPVPLCVGLGAAAEILSSGCVDGERKRIRDLRDQFVSMVQDQFSQCALNGAIGNRRHPGNANLCFEGYVAQDILMALQPHLHASTGSACNSGVVEPSYVLRAIGLSDEQARASVRFSFGRFTTDEEVNNSVEMIANVLRDLA